jgi:hypothetical protein
MIAKVCDDGVHSPVAQGTAGEVRQVSAMPPDDRRLDLDDRCPLDAVVRESFLQGEADAESADQDVSWCVRSLERRADEDSLRLTVAGVHEEDAIADDLEVLSVLTQDQLASRGLDSVES